ncbi:MAG: heme-copper oxidase subunit III [Planctomycetota bacterium]
MHERADPPGPPVFVDAPADLPGARTDKTDPAPGAEVLGMAWFLASLGVLFAAGVVGYLAVRVPAPDWGAGLPPLPRGLYASTAVLLASSATMHLALRGAQAGRPGVLNGGMLATTGLGALFLALQCLCWRELYVHAGSPGVHTLYGMTFYFLTMLHAVHVVGGLLPLVYTSARALRGRYGPEQHLGVRLCAMYWHFLDVVWLALFVVLVIIG